MSPLRGVNVSSEESLCLPKDGVNVSLEMSEAVMTFGLISPVNVRVRGCSTGTARLPALPSLVGYCLTEWLTSLSTFRAQSFSVVAGIRGKRVRAHAAI